MNINLDKFWEFVKQWTVGRLIALLLLLSLLVCQKNLIDSLGRETILTILLFAVLLEVFQLSADKLQKPEAKRLEVKVDEEPQEQSHTDPSASETASKTWLFGATLILSLLGIIASAAFVLYHLIQSR
jgi:hypothetical protein